MSSLRWRPTRIDFTSWPVCGSTRWIIARRRVATQSALGLDVIDMIPYGYETTVPSWPVLGSISTSWSGWSLPGTIPTQIEPPATAMLLGRNGTGIGPPIGRPVRALRRTTWFERDAATQSELPVTTASAEPKPILGAYDRTLPVLASTM